MKREKSGRAGVESRYNVDRRSIKDSSRTGPDLLVVIDGKSSVLIGLP